MRSSNHHINPDFSRFQLDLLQSENNRPMRQVFITATEYDTMVEHDPMTVYVVSQENGTVELYCGDVPMVNVIDKACTYTLGFHPESQSYILYRVIDNQAIEIAQLVEIDEYKDVNVALNALQLYNIANSSERQEINIYYNLLGFIEGSCTVNELVLGILGSLDNVYDPNFQDAIDAVQILVNNIVAFNHQNIRYDNKEITRLLLDAIEYDHRFQTKPLFCAYKDILNLLVKYNWFEKQKKELQQKEFPSFQEETKEILSIYQAAMRKPH